MNWLTIFINFLLIGFLIGALVKSNLKYKTLKLEWEKMNSDIDVLTCNYSKAKKEISDLQDQNDDLSIRCNNEIQRLTEKYEKKLSDTKAKMKILDDNYNSLMLKEAKYLTDLEEAEVREKSLLDTIAKLEKTLNENAEKIERNAKKIARAKKKEEKVEQLDISLEELDEVVFEVDKVEIAPGEGEIKCEKKRRRKKGDSK